MVQVEIYFAFSVKPQAIWKITLVLFSHTCVNTTRPDAAISVHRQEKRWLMTASVLSTNVPSTSYMCVRPGCE